MSATLEHSTECDILFRALDGDDADLAPEVAHTILRWKLHPSDAARLQDLADLNNEGELSEAGRRELAGYVRVGQFLAVLQAKARLSLMANGIEA